MLPSVFSVTSLTAAESKKARNDQRQHHELPHQNARSLPNKPIPTMRRHGMVEKRYAVLPPKITAQRKLAKKGKDKGKKRLVSAKGALSDGVLMV